MYICGMSYANNLAQRMNKVIDWLIEWLTELSNPKQPRLCCKNCVWDFHHHLIYFMIHRSMKHDISQVDTSCIPFSGNLLEDRDSNKRNVTVRSDVLRAAWLRIQVFWNITLCRWVFPDVSNVPQPHIVYTNLGHEDRGTVVVQ